MENTEQPYLFPEVQAANSTAYPQPLFLAPARREFSPARVLLHLGLLAATFVTTTITGAAWTVQTSDQSAFGFLLGPLFGLTTEAAGGNVGPLLQGLLFSFTLLTILGAHELGHYFACRYYGISATLPFFVPAPPVITLLGTFGAVIRIKEPITTRKALFDIGIAGPLAGFVFAIPAAVIGLVFAKEVLPPSLSSGEGLQFRDPLLFIIITKLTGAPHWIDWNPVYWAAWGAMLVTALNLFPAGQLDGGHVLYALFGRRAHQAISWVVCLGSGSLALYAYLTHQPPVYFLWTLILLFLTRAGHPPVDESEPLGAARIVVAILAAVVFLLCFMPLPITTG